MKKARLCRGQQLDKKSGRGQYFGARLGRFPSGQRGQTVNLLAIAFEGSNPSLPTRIEGPAGPSIFVWKAPRRMPFYDNGLRFECIRCGRCCRHEPGYVFLSRKDLARMAGHLGVAVETVLERYCRTIDLAGFVRISLEEKPNYDCIFWNRDGCEVYNGRPLQCRSFPFWPENITDRESWEHTAHSCPGIDMGRLHTAEEIQRWVRLRETEPIIVLKPEELAVLEKEPV